MQIMTNFKRLAASLLLGVFLTMPALAQKVDLTRMVTGILPQANGGTGTATPGFPSGAIVGTTDTQTLTNKLVQPRVNAVTHATAGDTITLPNSDTYDWVDISLSNASPGTITLAAPSTGTPVAGRTMIVCLKAVTTNAPTAYAYSSITASSDLPLPTTPSAFGKTDCLVLRYFGLTSSWQFTAKNFGF